MMKAIALALLFAAGPLAGNAEDLSKLNNQQLVERLISLDNQTSGLEGAAVSGALDPTAKALKSSCPPTPPLLYLGPSLPPGTFTPRPPPTLSPIVAELVRRGSDALPALLDHLNDARRTKFLLAEELSPDRQKAFTQRTSYVPPWLEFTWGSIRNRYDPRRGPIQNDGFGISSGDGMLSDQNFARVGDLSYFLIGQIVNRELSISWYAASAGANLASPITFPKLASSTRVDWAGLTRDQHRDSLLTDTRTGKSGYERDRAFLMLRYYYPDIYAGLKGGDLEGRTAFERRLCADRFGSDATPAPKTATAARIDPDGR